MEDYYKEKYEKECENRGKLHERIGGKNAEIKHRDREIVRLNTVIEELKAEITLLENQKGCPDFDAVTGKCNNI